MTVWHENLVSIQFRGLNTSDPELPDGALNELINYQYSMDGGIYKRKPLIPVSNDGGAGAGNNSFPLCVYMPAGGANGRFLIYAKSNLTQLWYLDLTNWANKVQITFTGTPGTIYHAVQFRDKLYVSCQNGLWSWALPAGGSAAQVPGAPVNCVSLIGFKDRLWMIGLGSSTLYYSELAPSQDTWGSNQIVINSGDGFILTCVIPMDDKLLIFKENSCFTLYHPTATPSTWVIRVLNSNIGTAFSYGAYKKGQYIYVLDHTTCWVTDGSQFVDIGNPIRASIYRGADGSGSVSEWDQDTLLFRWNSSNMYLFHIPSRNWSRLWRGTNLGTTDQITRGVYVAWPNPAGTPAVFFGDMLNSNILTVSYTGQQPTQRRADPDANGNVAGSMVSSWQLSPMSFGDKYKVKNNKYNYLFLRYYNFIAAASRLSFKLYNLATLPVGSPNITWVPTLEANPEVAGIQIPGLGMTRELYYRFEDTSPNFFDFGGIAAANMLERNIPEQM